jgi:tRNA-Thr(GGU) m(6)t(6)A37 methyltransferase TsaA
MESSALPGRRDPATAPRLPCGHGECHHGPHGGKRANSPEGSEFRTNPVLEAIVNYEVVPIGWVESPLTDRAQAPRQGDEGAPPAWLTFETHVTEGIRDLRAGTDIIVLTWFDRAHRDVLVTRPRDDPARPPLGVFSTRSPDRPNPIGLHRVHVIAVEGSRVLVRDLEALDGTPLVDVKPVLDKTAER